jgi:hypothetical protein
LKILIDSDNQLPISGNKLGLLGGHGVSGTSPNGACISTAIISVTASGGM